MRFRVPTALQTPAALPEPLAPPRKRWTRSECAAGAAIGVWEHEHLELIDGELIDRMGKNRPHANTAWLVVTWLIQTFGVEFVQPEVSIDG